MTRVLPLLALGIALPLAVASSAAQDVPSLLPPPDGITLESVIAEVIATERREVRSGPAYIVVREKTEMSPMPILSVYKKIAGLGYFHLPPAYLKSEFCEGAREANDTFCQGTNSQSAFAMWHGTLASYAVGLAVIADLHVQGSGQLVLETGRDVVSDMMQRDFEDFEDMVNADDDLRAHTATLRRLMTEADEFGITEIDGEEYWYLSADGLNLRQGTGSHDFEFEGTVTLDRGELWIDKETHRIARLRFTGEGSEDARFSVIDRDAEDYSNDGSTSIFMNINSISVDQIRQDYRDVLNTGYSIPYIKYSAVNMTLSGDRDSIIYNLRLIARDRNVLLDSFDEGLITREQWERSNRNYEEQATHLEWLLELSLEPFESVAEVFVECAVPADDVATVAANLATLARAAHDLTECG